ncbi:MAG: ribosome maturation factor RimP [Deltaproteobacteria bacterium]|nr:ribosome maturation factor RimP [Deltaproteobacteria bacterium]
MAEKGKKPDAPPTEDAATRKERIVRQATRLLSPVLAAEGLELLLVEYKREPGGRVLRLYVDREGGVSIDDCATASRLAGDLLAVQLEAEGPYRLEVTSPGADRPLTATRHFNRFLGERAKIKTKTPLEGRKKFTGVIEGADENFVTLLVDGERWAIPRDAVVSARLHPH